MDVKNSVISLVTATLLAFSVWAVAATPTNGLDEARRLLEQGKTSAAYEALQRYAQSHAEDAEALFLLGRAAQASQQIDQAIDAYEKALQLRPDAPEVYNNLGVLYAARGDEKRARDFLFTALNTQPVYATAYQNLARLYATLASNAYTRALNASTDGNPPRPPALPALTAVEQWSDMRPAPSKAGVRADDAKKQVQETLTAWSQAWSKADADRYFKFYAPQFWVPDGLSRADWESQRRARLAAPKFIEIKLRQLDIRPLDTATVALANFDQVYRSDTFNDTVKKFMVLKKSGDRWLILQEVTGN